MSYDILVSVIIPTYGRNEYLSRAIDSVLDQTYKNIEIIIVNDNPYDSTYYSDFNNIVEKYSKNRVIFVSDGHNVGGGGARNKGIIKATGEYITFLDDDDYYCKNKIEKQLQYMISNDCDICLCDMFFLEGNTYKEVSNCYARGEELVEFLIRGNAYTPMIMVKSALIRAVHGFEVVPRFQDHILMIKLLGKGGACLILREKLFVHNNHKGERITFSDKTFEGYKARWKIESEYISLLNAEQLKKYSLKKASIEMKIFRAKGDIVCMLRSFKNMVLNMNNFGDCVVCIKTVIRVLFFPRRTV